MGANAPRLIPFAIAVVLPPAGLILGLLQLTQEDRVLGLRIIVVSILAAVIWVWLFTGF
jgi:hypothetical protein